MKTQGSGLYITILLPLLFISAVGAEEPLRPLPHINKLNLDADKVDLGKRLFHDVRLSGNNTISCASCHDVKQGGADQRKYSRGIDGRLGNINSPTIFNTAYNFRLFWDGRATSLEEQVSGPIHNKIEMDSNWDDIITKLMKDELLMIAFDALFDDPIKPEHIEICIAEFQRSLITPSRFDRYLRGETDAISDEELLGYKKFKSYGCTSCHQGVNVGGNMFQKFGVMGDYFRKRGGVTEADLGRFNVTKRERDKHVFKVPGLRNVELTAPYFHDGSVNTLQGAVDVMFKYQLGRPAPEEDKNLIVTFLKALTGEELLPQTKTEFSENKQ